MRKKGIEVEVVKRGLDHGVWAAFECGKRIEHWRGHVSKGTDELSAAFNPDDNPLNVPIVQVSLFDSEDPIQHYRLGLAVTAWWE